MKNLIKTLVIILLLLSSCSINNEKIIVGSCLPLSGADASYGINAKRGMDLALEIINEQGGVNGKKLEVLYEDDSGIPKNGTSIMTKFATDERIQVVIGAVHSTVTLAMASVANKYKKLLISPISSSALLTQEGGDYFFRIAPSDAFQARILASWISKMQYWEVGLVYVNNIWGKSLADEFSEYFKREGGKVVSLETSKVGDTDFRLILSKVVKQKPKALVFLTQAKEGGILVKQVKELGIKIPIFGGDTWSSVEFLTSTGKSSDSVRIVMPGNYEGDEYKVFAAKFQKKFGEKPDINAAYSFDAVNIISKAIEKVGYNSDAIKNYLYKMDVYHGASGLTKFNERGDCTTKSFQRILFEDGNKLVVN